MIPVQSLHAVWHRCSLTRSCSAAGSAGGRDGAPGRPDRCVERLRAERDSLRAERDAVQVERDTAAAQLDKLRLMIRQLLPAQYGRRSETLDADQLQLELEEVEQSLGTAQAPA